MKKLLFALPPLLLGCASNSSYVRSDTTLGRVVVYRNGVAYFERTARVEDDTLRLSVPADKIDDFLKSLTVTDAKTGERAPVDFPSGSGGGGLTEMKIHLAGKRPHELKLTYVTETPAWKPSYRIVLGKDKKVDLEAWAIVDNTSGEDWNNVKLGVGSSSALSFRFDLRSVRLVQREMLQTNDLFAQAPPLGGATYGPSQQERRVLGELSDGAIAQAAPEPPPPAAPALVTVSESKVALAPKALKKRASDTKHSGDMPAAAAGAATGRGQVPPSDVANMAAALRASNRSVVIEGYADKSDADKVGASLDRANRVRDELIKNGVDPNRVVAMGQGEQAGRAGGVRVVEAPAVPAPQPAGVKKENATPPPQTLEPIGTSHFESTTAMTVAKGTSAMVSILDAKTSGEVVYLYDSESARGNASFPFKAVRLQNPTESTLESGPVTVFGEGRFIGEGMAEPIPAHSTAFVPFALDRQIVVERKDSNRDKIARILSVQRGVFSSEVEHTRSFAYVFHNRLSEPATVYVKHTVGDGYELRKDTKSSSERIGAANLFRVELPPSGSAELAIDESTPVFRTIDLRSPPDMDQVRVFLSAGAVEGPLKSSIEDLIKTQQDLGNIEQRILTTRDQMQAYRTRMDELHAQVLSLRLVKTGAALMRNLEKKLQDVSDKLSQTTVDLAALEEKAMLLRIHFQDGVAELSLEKKSG
jgi:hypothetical protein